MKLAVLPMNLALFAVASCVRGGAPTLSPQPTNAPMISTTSNELLPDTSQSTTDAEDRSVDAAAVALSPCDASTYPALRDYSDIAAGARFSLVVRRAPSGAWGPAAPLRMPLHHASTIVFEPALDTMIEERERGGLVLVLAVGLGRRSIEHDPRRGAFFATYAARPERTCPAR
jgi:hypothetical protein